ncbi:MAG: DUF1761 domain-containing protein [Chloroflexota bacterium]
MITFDLNWFAIIVAGVVNMAIGAGWYGAFAEPWMAGNGFTREQIEANADYSPYIVAIANSIVMPFVLANVMNWAGVSGLVNGLLLGLLMWLGFTAFTMGSNHAFESRGFTMWGINAGMYMVGLMVIGAIIGVWQ